VKTKHSDIEKYQVDDFEVRDYVCHDTIKMTMRK